MHAGSRRPDRRRRPRTDRPNPSVPLDPCRSGRAGQQRYQRSSMVRKNRRSPPSSSRSRDDVCGRFGLWPRRSSNALNLGVNALGSSTVKVATPAAAIHLGPELAFQLHEAPDPGAVGADIRLDVGSRLADGGQGRRRAAPRTAPAAPRSAGPRPGRAKSPPDQRIEHKFESISATLRSPPGAAQRLGGSRWGRNSADPGGQQRITKLEVSGGSGRSTWGAKPLE
jgi:hypothetical protein